MDPPHTLINFTTHEKVCLFMSDFWRQTTNSLWPLQAWDSCALEAHRANSSFGGPGRSGQALFPSSKWLYYTILYPLKAIWNGSAQPQMSTNKLAYWINADFLWFSKTGCNKAVLPVLVCSWAFLVQGSLACLSLHYQSACISTPAHCLFKKIVFFKLNSTCDVDCVLHWDFVTARLWHW